MERIFQFLRQEGEDIFNKRFENTPFHEHAEEIMLCDKDFLDAVAAHHHHHHHGIEITLTLNYSPCSNCAKRLKKFYENNGKNTNFTIQFSFLYRIQEEKKSTWPPKPGRSRCKLTSYESKLVVGSWN